MIAVHAEIEARALAELTRGLLDWYRRSRRDLPWRRTRDPYAIWLSEVMLQQTQVVTVIPYWERFLARFPTVHDLAAAELPEVLSLWSGLGYYSRARTLHRTAQLVAATHGGRFPQTAAALAELPGFGPYTSGAVASIAFGERTPAVDGNVVRVLARIFEVEGEPTSRAVQTRIRALAEALVPAEAPGDFNQALMELGATICAPKGPTCLLCPVRERCGALRSGRVGELPWPKARPERKRLRRSCAVVRRGDAVLLGRRPESGLFAGLWELPSAEGDGRALVALLGAGFTVGEPLSRVQRTLTHRELELELFEVGAPRAVKALAPYVELRWADAPQSRELGMASAMRACLDAVWPALRPAPPAGRAARPRRSPRR